MKRQQPINRRQFLEKTAIFGAAIASPTIISSSVLGRDGSTAPSERITMGVIGSGLQGTYDLQNFLGFGDVQVVAIADVDRSHREAAACLVNKKYGNQDCIHYNDFRKLNDRKDIDVVTIATPDHWHVLAAIDAVKKKKDTYVQKPLAWSIEEGRALVNAVQKHNCILQTGSQQRSTKQFRYACELVRNGRIGKLKYINIGIPGNNKSCGPTWTPETIPEGFDYDFWLGPAPWAEYHHQRCHYEFRFLLDYSGGQVTNFGAHNLDIAQWGLDMDNSGPVDVSGNGVFPESGLFTTATQVYFECHYANGVELVCKTGSFGMTFEGTEGTIYVDRKRIATLPNELQEEKIADHEIHLYESNDHYRNFIDSVKSREKTICDEEVGHRSSSVCNLGNIAMRLGRRLVWDPEAERFVNDNEANQYLGREMRGEWSLDT